MVAARQKKRQKLFPLLCATLICVAPLVGFTTSSSSSSSSLVAAKGIYVNPSQGEDTDTCGERKDVNLPCRTLGQAYLRAEEGDTIFLAPGVYGKDEGARSSSDSSGPSHPVVFNKSHVYVVPLIPNQRPVIDLALSHTGGPLFDFRNCSQVTLRGVAIRNGNGHGSGKQFLAASGTAQGAQQGGGCLRFVNSEVHVEDVEFSGCRTSGSGGRGGAVYIQDSRVIFSRCVFRNNTADLGGVVFAEGNAWTMANFENSLFIHNRAAVAGGVASAHTQGGQLTWDNCTFQHSAAAFGGVVETGDVSVNLFSRSQFENSIATNAGGIVYGYWSSHTLLQNCTALRSHAAVFGGSLFCRNRCRLHLSGVSFQNSTSGRGGGVMSIHEDTHALLSSVAVRDAGAQERGGAIETGGGANLTLFGGHIQRSSASRGGAIFATGDSSVEVRFSSIANCRAELGGGVFLNTTRGKRSSLFGQATFLRNSAWRGSAIYSSAPVRLENVSFVENQAQDGDLAARGTIYLKEEEEEEEEEEGSTGQVVKSSCDFFETALDVTSLRFVGNRVMGGPGSGIFWDTRQSVRGGACRAEDIAERIVKEVEDLGEHEHFLASNPQGFIVETAQAVSPGAPFDLRIQAVDAFGQTLKGTHQGVRVTVRPAVVGIILFQNVSSPSYQGVATGDGVLVARNLVIDAAPETEIVLEVHGNASTLSDPMPVSVVVGPCPSGHAYSPAGRRCIPECDETFLTYEVEACSRYDTERWIRYAWAWSRPSDGRGGEGEGDWWKVTGSGPLCAGGLAKPEDRAVSCWFVSPHSVVARSFFASASVALAAHAVAAAFLLAYYNEKCVRLGQPACGLLILLGNTLCLAYVFVSVGRPSGTLCTSRLLLLGVGFTLAFGSMLIKAHRLSDILDNKNLEKARRLKQLTVLFSAVMALDVATLALVALVWPLAVRASHRQEGYATVEESACFQSNEAAMLCLCLMKLLQGIAGIASAWKAAKVGRLSREARLVCAALFEWLVSIGITVVAVVLLRLDAYPAYALSCSCILFCTCVSLGLVVLPSLLQTILEPWLSSGMTEKDSSTMLHFFTAYSQFKEGEVKDAKRDEAQRERSSQLQTQSVSLPVLMATSASECASVNVSI